MNRRDFIKLLSSLPFVSWRVDGKQVITADDIEDKRTEITWKVVNLGQPVTGVVNWNNRMYAVGTDGDIFASDNCFSTWTKVESGYIDSYIDSIHKF